MGYLLLWISSLLAAVLLLSLVLSLCHKLKPFGIFTTLGALLLLPLPMTTLLGFFISLKIAGIDSGWIIYFSSWLLVYGLTSLFLLISSKFKFTPEHQLWPTKQLAILLFIFLMLTGFIHWRLDNASLLQLQSLRDEANAQILANASVNIPPEQNAAVQYSNAFDYMHQLIDTFNEQSPESYKSLTTDFDLLEKNDSAEIDEMLRQLAPVLSQIRQASTFPDCHFERDYSQTLSITLPELTSFRTASDLLRSQAIDFAQSGDSAAALANVKAQLNMAKHMMNEPFLITLLVGVALENNAMETLQQVIRIHPPDQKALQALDNITPIDTQAALKRALRYETGLTMYAMSQVISHPEAHPELSTFLTQEYSGSHMIFTLYTGVYRVFMLDHEISHYRRIMSHYIKLSSSPYHLNREALDTLNTEVNEELSSILANLIVPSIKATSIRAARGQAYHRLIQLTLAIEKYKLQHNALPKSLNDVLNFDNSVNPIDPFNGEMLGYEVQKDGVLIYSVGDDSRRGSLNGSGEDIELLIPMKSD